ncbi:radical SAM protein [Candidatus Termititenax persephonae]|uniref:Radical SAM protein n=1 Tax=Candidatus Termititenax persephonae TaxID=2218525 RepID=A0A388TH42_9BACT|nr:radical SAM protein [Candidatus Termititenax persephonae]
MKKAFKEGFKQEITAQRISGFGSEIKFSEQLQAKFNGLLQDNISPGQRQLSLQIFAALYAFPDIRVSELLAAYNLSLPEIKKVYAVLKPLAVLKELFSEHPLWKNFFYKLKTLIQDSELMDKLNKGEFIYPRAIEIHPSIRCNFRCEFCYSKDNWQYLEERTGQTPLTVSAWEKLLAEGQKNGLQTVFISGGLEPLMAKEKTLAVARKALALGIKPILFCNGSLINVNNETELYLLLSLNTLAISLKGISPETYRKTVVSYSNFARLVEIIDVLCQKKRISKSATEIILPFFISENTYQELPQLIDLVNQHDWADSVVLGLSTDNIITRKNALQNREAMYIGNVLTDLVNNSHIRFNTNDTLNDFMFRFNNNNIPAVYNYQLRNVPSCKYWELRPAINPYGKVFPCCFVSMPGIAPVSKQPYLGIVSAETSLADILIANASNNLNTENCFSCNPAEKSGLRGVAKLKADFTAGLDYQLQPY